MNTTITEPKETTVGEVNIASPVFQKRDLGVCDSCGAKSATVAYRATDKATLEYCMHHTNKYEEGLTLKGFRIITPI